MAWSWSHTQEAYDNAEYNLYHQDREWLEICYAEIQSSNWCEHYGLVELEDSSYNASLERAKELSSDELARYIWQFAKEYRTCTNGGWEAYMCPFWCHTVSFDRGEIRQDVS